MVRARISRRLLSFFLAAATASASQPVRTRHAMVATGEAHATDAAVAVLRTGGNAVDAAVAAGFALAVTHSAMCGLGGGAYMLIRFADGRTSFIDFRERAPGKASRDMFLAPDGKVSPDSVTGWRSAAVPGTVRGLEHAWRKFGSKPWTDLLRPAIDLAEKGATVTWLRAKGFRDSAARLEQFPESKRIFLKGGVFFQPGDTFRQPELAQTLRRIAAEGSNAFYEGVIARRLVQAMSENGGLINADDLRSYTVAEREALRGSYRGYDILTAAPSSAGGFVLLATLGILEGSGYEKHGAASAGSIHWMAEAMRRVYADRNEYFGDPDFVRVPVPALLNPRYLAGLRGSIDPERSTPSSEVRAGKPPLEESENTTHYSVVDALGNAVAVTYTLNSGFGSAVTVPGLGFLLNNNMDNFAPRPGHPNNHGLVQGEANAIEPRKRPLSSMTPTIVTKDGKLKFVVGTPGGPTIPTAVTQVIVNIIDFGMNAQEAVDAPRIHHQWLPDELLLERGFSPDTVALLRARGHKVEARGSRNDMMAIRIGDDGWIEGAADRRREGKAAGY